MYTLHMRHCLIVCCTLALGCAVIEKYQSEQHAESRGQEVREAFTGWLAEKKQQQQLHREEEEAHQLRDDWRSETQTAVACTQTIYFICTPADT